MIKKKPAYAEATARRGKKFYITTSIPYTNAAPHIGFALEIIQADVLARYNRVLGNDTFFLTGTDEHGIKTLRVARELGRDVKDYADEVSGKFKSLAKVLNISNDDFIRTTDEIRHKPAVEKLWKKFDEKGDIYKKKYKGYYCPGCEAFKTEKEMVDGKCAIHLKELESVEEENYFFKLSKYTDKIKELILKNKLVIIPESRKNETLAMLNQGMEDVSFSRMKDKYWGWPVPGDESQNLYVWMDALANYISAIGYYEETKQFKKYWPADVHCLGKDIMKFHTIFWPAMLLSAGLELPKTIFVHAFINVGGQKMSKSLGNVINPFDLVKKYGVDSVRYYLLREILPTEDGDFTYEKFEQKYNSDLASGIGNLLARTRAMSEYVNLTKISPSGRMINYLTKEEDRWESNVENFKFNEALICIWDIIHYCDSYINETEPWEKRKGYEQVLKDLIWALSLISSKLLPPFLPETSKRIEEEIEIDKKTGKFKNKRGKLLFPRI